MNKSLFICLLCLAALAMAEAKHISANHSEAETTVGKDGEIAIILSPEAKEADQPKPAILPIVDKPEPAILPIVEKPEVSILPVEKIPNVLPSRPGFDQTQPEPVILPIVEPVAPIEKEPQPVIFPVVEEAQPAILPINEEPELSILPVEGIPDVLPSSPDYEQSQPEPAILPIAEPVAPIVMEPQPVSSMLRDYPTCGGVLEASDDLDVLSYNMEKPKMTKYVSCIWTIHAINRSLLKINFTDPLINNYFAVGYFRKSNYDLIDSLIWNKIPYSVQPQYLEVPGPVAFVHYYTSDDHARFGFRMTFQAAGDVEIPSFNFENYFLDGEFGHFSYPVVGDKYKNNLRATFVVKASSSVKPAVDLYVKDIYNSTNCLDDSLNFYSYGEGSGTWYKNQTLCGNSKYYHTHLPEPRNDPVIITFQSDYSDTGSGFDILWYSYQL